MKRTLLLRALLFAYLSCIQANQPSDLVGTWELEAYHNLETGTREYNDRKDKGTVELTFKDDGKTGSFLGHTISNTLNGTYVLAGKENITIERCGEPDAG